MRLAYADPPYPGLAHLYADQPDFDGELDHGALVRDLIAYDGWALSTASTTLQEVLAICPAGVRIGAWCKTWYPWRKNVQPGYAWEPVIFSPARQAAGRAPGAAWVHDWLAHPTTTGRGLVGAKPEAFAYWVFDLLGAEPGDQLDDLLPGTGAIGLAWESWVRQRRLPFVGRAEPDTFSL